MGGIMTYLKVHTASRSMFLRNIPMLSMQSSKSSKHLLKSHGDDSRKIDRFSALLVRQFAEGEVAPHPHQMAAAVTDGESHRHRAEHGRSIYRLDPVKHGVTAWAGRSFYPDHLCHDGLTHEELPTSRGSDRTRCPRAMQ